MIEPDDKKLNFIDIEKATTARDGYLVITNRFWSVCPDRGVIFFKPKPTGSSYGAPQCNSDERLAEDTRKRLYPWAETKFIPAVFVPHNCNDFC
jgi:hypothetical protein